MAVESVHGPTMAAAEATDGRRVPEPSQALGVSAARKLRQRAARAAVDGRLRAALARVEALEQNDQVLRAIVVALQALVPGAMQCATDYNAADLAARVVCVAPALAAGAAAQAVGGGRALARTKLGTHATARRNTASHIFNVSGKDIQRADLATLNRWQREGSDLEHEAKHPVASNGVRTGGISGETIVHPRPLHYVEVHYTVAGNEEHEGDHPVVHAVEPAVEHEVNYPRGERRR